MHALAPSYHPLPAFPSEVKRAMAKHLQNEGEDTYGTLRILQGVSRAYYNLFGYNEFWEDPKVPCQHMKWGWAKIEVMNAGLKENTLKFRKAELISLRNEISDNPEFYNKSRGKLRRISGQIDKCKERVREPSPIKAPSLSPFLLN